MINYFSIMKTISRRANCSDDEAWSGLSAAYITLDRSFDERLQCWYLIKYGTLAVIDEIRGYYSGTVKKYVEYEDNAHGSASHADEWAFLEAFPVGYVRDFAELLASGIVKKGTESSASNWLRKTHNINTRKLPRQIIKHLKLYGGYQLG